MPRRGRRVGSTSAGSAGAAARRTRVPPSGGWVTESSAGGSGRRPHTGCGRRGGLRTRARQRGGGGGRGARGVEAERRAGGRSEDLVPVDVLHHHVRWLAGEGAVPG